MSSAAIVALAVACSESTKGGPSGGGTRAGEGVTLPDGTVFTRAALLDAFAQCAIDHADAFAQKASALQSAAADAAANPTDAAKRDAARAAWVEAIDLWQQNEVMQFGPAASKELPGGKSLRELIYSWPIGARCPVEQVVVDRSYETPDFAKSLVSARSLTAVEYLLFYEGTDNACAANVAINANGTWAAIAAPELATRKLVYAHAAAQDVALRATALSEAWSPAKENFRAAFTGAGKGSKIYTSERIAINAVSDAMFYLEADVKDHKLGQPAGLSNCTTTTCPEALESHWAHRSKEHVRSNLVGFRKLFVGCGEGDAGLGFEDYLIAVGSPEVASEMRRDIDAAIASVDALPEPTFEAALQTNLAGVQAIHAAVKQVTDLLRTQFITVLDLEIAKRVEGDTD